MYYVMEGRGEHPIRRIRKGPDGDDNWRDGQPITTPVPQPLRYQLVAGMPGLPKAMYYAEGIPVMRDDLVGALQDAGVDNIQYFDAVLFDPDTQVEHRNFKAYNIIGLVSCADMGASVRIDGSDSELLDVDFASLVIDESRTGGALLFRLAENVSAIVVHERVKQAIEARGIPGMLFYGPGEWSG